MKVVLLEDVKGLGKANEVVEVREGYAQNFLIKKNLAAELNRSNMNVVRQKKGAQEHRAKLELEAAQAMRDKLDKKKITLEIKAGEGGKLYGAVTAMDIEQVLKNEGFEIDKKKINIDRPIKNEGQHDVSIKLHPKVTVSIIVNVLAKP